VISAINRISTSIKALQQLGPSALVQYARYRAALRSGALKKETPPGEEPWEDPQPELGIPPVCLLPLPDRQEVLRLLDPRAVEELTREAGEIVSGQVRLFGGDPVPLQLVPPGPLFHWTGYEQGRAAWGVLDVKLIWEPARFSWAFTLCRAYHLTGDEQYARTYWEHTEAFLDANPTNLGPNWASAQEAALRLMAFSFALGVFAGSPHTTPERQKRLRAAIAAHADRIPPTLAYARAQNNNHLLTEAAGLYTAGLILPQHPSAAIWRELGRRWLNHGILTQIDEDGTYTQNSTNYHRLMLQSALWAHSLQPKMDPAIFTAAALEKLSAATLWLASLVDPISGAVPNLGPNDGAYIMPLTGSPFSDFRPVLQAAALTFLQCPLLPPGPWDEMSAWFGLVPPEQPAEPPQPVEAPKAPYVLSLSGSDSWAYLRSARFHSRPGHADQLHFDLWWRGINLALDPGTYHYNASPPWQNTLAHTAFHNTLTVNGADQMRRAGRFLWLDWAQSSLEDARVDADGNLLEAAVQHDGYRRVGIIHRRRASAGQAEWHVRDDLIPTARLRAGRLHTARLHWLLPDWEWDLDEENSPDLLTLRLRSPHGWVRLEVRPHLPAGPAGSPQPTVELVRAGECLRGSPQPAPQAGWYSPTYAKKMPALSFAVALTAPLPLGFTTRWVLGDHE
jgi:hypothetical protein